MSTTLLKLSCPDRVGLLSRITTFVAQHGGNLTEVHQFTDSQAGWFFTRLEIETGSLLITVDALRIAFESLGRELEATWSIRLMSERPRVVMMVSKIGHCLADLLWQWRSGELAADIACVISNHNDFREMVERESIPFHHVPVTPETRDETFAKMETLWQQASADLVVLARYMQVIPSDVCDRWPGRLMNIHHSFLPSFVGANPYQRAFERGVKLIGATCHYVTADLDAGPIIDQEVIRVEHSHSVEDMLRHGRDCERAALSRGLRWHLADRVLLHGSRTVVFKD